MLLLLAAAIWGGGFVAQSSAMASIGPFWFVGLRFAIAAMAVLPFAAVSSSWDLPCSAGPPPSRSGF